ncbi:MAG: family 78 glycoside hydrolase catalytic domain [Lachnospiraceae bacterium]|nr:family 78 glycoside hydrolase catalytic domain [Lachnospiraceae bacterium]
MKRKSKARTRRRCRRDALKLLFVMLVIISVTVGIELLVENLTVVQNLKINSESRPMGVSTDQTPCFSWNMSSKVRGQSQESYEIRVYEGETGQGQPIWTSGVVKSGDSMNIKPDGLKLEKEKRYSWRVLVQPSWGWKVTSGVATFVTDTDFEDAEWIMPEQDGVHASLLRKEAKVSRMTVEEAYLYIASMGNYRAYVEGMEVTDVDGGRTVLAPGWTDYKTMVNYQTYDVTEAFSGNLFDSRATIGIELSNGWYGSDYGESATDDESGGKGKELSANNGGSSAGNKSEKKGKLLATDYGYGGGYASAFGPDDDKSELGVIARLVLRYANGKTQEVTTNANDWYSSCYSDVSFSVLEGGTRLKVDGGVSREIKGWQDDGYTMPVQRWYGVQAAEYSGRLVSSNAGAARIADEYGRSPVSAYKYDETENLSAADAGNTYGEVVKQVADLKKKIRLSIGERLILDYGRYASGQVDLTVSGTAGIELSLTYAKWLNDGHTNVNSADGSGGVLGSIGTNGAVTYTYRLSGDGEERFFPTETYEGYRYVEIMADGFVTVHSAIGRVFTSVGKQTGSITTSNEDLNRLVSDITWNQIANSVSVPNRDVSRGGREGDLAFAQVLAVSNLYNMDSIPFYKNLNEIMQAYAAATEGMYGTTGPVSTEESTRNGAGSSDAGILIPWQLYQQTGDPDILEAHFNDMVMYTNRLFSESYSMPLSGDPMALVGTSGNCMGEIYRLYCTLIMQLSSDFTGRADYAAAYEEKFVQLKEEFMNKYLDEDGNLLSSSADGVVSYADGTPVADNSQTALLWALKLSLYRDYNQQSNMLANLVANIRNPGGQLRSGNPEKSLSVGLFGINIALPVLSDEGYSDVAYGVLLQEEYPSWIYNTRSGGRGSYLDGNAADSVSEWLYRYMAGITQDAYEPGFGKIVLQPTVDTAGGVTKAAATYDSPAGLIASGWEAAGGKMRIYTCEVPANATAKLYLPISQRQAASMKRPKGAEYSGMETHNGQLSASYELTSGKYKFKIPKE